MLITEFEKFYGVDINCILDEGYRTEVVKHDREEVWLQIYQGEKNQLEFSVDSFSQNEKSANQLHFTVNINSKYDLLYLDENEIWDGSLEDLLDDFFRYRNKKYNGENK